MLSFYILSYIGFYRDQNKTFLRNLYILWFEKSLEREILNVCFVSYYFVPLAFEFVDLSSNQIREKYQSIDNLEMFTIYHQTRVNLQKYLHQVAEGILVFSNHILNFGSMFLGA